MSFANFITGVTITLFLACPVDAEIASPGRQVHELKQRETSLFGYEESYLSEQDAYNLFSGHDAPALNSGECRIFPGDEDWPAQSEWAAFNDELGGALIQTIPLAAPCYQDWGIYDEQTCDAVTTNFSDPYYHEADPTSMMWPIWQGRTCMPTQEANDTCTLGAYPVYAVNISSVEQIQQTIAYARTHNLRLVIKNTGHCYLGKSGGAGALSVWTHNLKDIELVSEYSNANYTGPAFRVGAGVTVREIYEAAHSHGYVVPGGICESVGYGGGYLAGGGHTPMSGLYGMGTDSALEFHVVTANGTFITANETSNADLFWALRGGGGSTFGIVTSAIVMAHPSVPIVTSSFSFSTSADVSNETFWLGIRAFFEDFIPYTDASTYSWWSILSSNGTTTLTMHPFFAPNHTVESFGELVQPWFDRLTELGIPFTPNTTYYEEFLPAYNDNFGIVHDADNDLATKDSVGSVVSMPGNWLFPRHNWEDPAKFNATWDAIQAHGAAGVKIFGYHQAPRNRLGVDNAVSSAWREAIAFLITGATVPADATAEDLHNAHEEINALLEPWRQVAPTSEGGGSYLNEAHVMEPNWQEAFYGEQYTELLRLKRKWDPSDVFYATTGVGSESWEVRTEDQGVQTQNGRLCRQ
ncbi:hypothetical protein G7054_g14899 [Neopestalotiopsis clavispora]|nr:hypothetical protein G7054_g14899 [Neopestalotiopsis clavispora]